MKILLVNYRFFAGAGDITYVWNLAELLEHNGHSVFFFSMAHPQNRFDPNQDLFMENIDYRRLNNSKSIRNGLKVLSRVIYSYEARRKFSKLLDRIQPDVIHLQNIHHQISPSIIFEAKKRNLPIIWTLHDFKLVCPNTSYFIDRSLEICEACGCGAFYQATLKKCKKNSFLASFMATIEAYSHRMMKITEPIDAFLSPSKFLRDKFIEKGFDPKRIYHLPLFPSLTFQPLNQKIQGDYILFMGRINPIKGVQTLIEACKLAGNVKVYLAGYPEFPWGDKLISMLPPNAEYLGMKQRTELRDLLANARAVVIPSIWYENQPFSILEAFSYGKPVIASDLGGMTELVMHRERGLLFKAGNASDLAGAMSWMMNHPDESKKMGAQAYHYVKTIHSPEVHYKKLIQIYNSVLEKKL